MHKVKQIKEKLEEVACSVLNTYELGRIDTKELGEVIDMIKDCTEAMYYHKICEAMEESEEEKKIQEKLNKKNYNLEYRDPNYSPYMKGNDGEYHYPIQERYYTPDKMPNMTGRVMNMNNARKNYEHFKQMHKGVDGSFDQQQKEMRELESYMKELAEDLTEMIADATDAEKNMLKQKLASLQQKIV